MPKQAAHGRFVWHELAVPSQDAAQSFYLKVTPWKTEPWDHSPDYTLLTNDGTPLGGIAELPKDLAARGVPPHWLPYVSVYDVDACARQAVALGGQLRMGPKEVPNIGAWAVIADPQGATLGIYEPVTPRPPAGPPRVGDFSWHELTASDYKAAAEFYRAMFRWERMSDYDMGEMGIYSMFGQGGETYGGMFNRSSTMPPPNWLSYVRVSNVKSVAEQVKQLSGTVLNGPMEVPGGDWIAQCLDPQGAAFALHTKSQSS
jgi:predicted enzyme related to lactoylglutathione lyase